MAPLATHCKSVAVLKILCTLSVGVRSELQKDQSSSCGEFSNGAREPAGLSLHLYAGPNERVTLGTNTTITAAGF